MGNRIHIDIDGTLTDNTENSWGNPIESRLQRVRELVAQGHIVVLWSARGGAYAGEFAQRHGLDGCLTLPKPDFVIDDNPTIRPRDFIRPPEWLDGK